MFAVFLQFCLVSVVELAAQNGKHLVIHMALTQVAKCLNDGAALASSGGDVARGGVLENNFTLAELDPSGCPVGQEDDFHRHLIRKTQDVCGAGTGGLKPDRVPADQRLGHRVSACGHAAQYRMVNRIIVKPPRELANNAFARKAGQRHADRTRVSKLSKVSWGEDPTPAVAKYNCSHFWLNNLR